MFNLFKKKTYTKDIINPLDNINIDNYKDLNTKEKELVNNLINEYKLLFKNNISIIDIDKDLNKEFIMYQELILNIISKLDNNNILESIISLLKLKVYLDELNTIYDKLKYKYIALKELKNNKEYIRKETLKYYLGKRKININNSLPNIINNISISLLNTYSLINIVNKEIINLSSIAINTNLNDYDNEINNKLNKVNKDYNLSFNNYLNIDNNLTKLVLEQIELEKFTYLNKDKKEELLNKLNKISNTEIKTKEEQQEIINNLLQIKTYFNIFNTYGRNIIKEEELNDLYQIIFNAYTYFTYDCEDFIKYYNNTYGYEKNYYDKIINFKIEMLKQGKSQALESINNQDKEEIKELLLEYIHKNPNNVSLILSLEEEKGLENYFKNTFNCNEKKSLLNFSLLSLLNRQKKYDNKETFISQKFNTIYLQTKREDTSLYDIFKLAKRLYVNFHIFPRNIYRIFEITFENKLNFNIISYGIEDFKSDVFKEYLNKCSKNQPIILPETVKDITLNTKAFNSTNKFPYIKLPITVDNLTINNEENLNQANIIIPLQIKELYIYQAPFSVINLILRKEVLQMNNEELKHYLNKIYLPIIKNIKKGMNYHLYSKKDKIEQLRIFVNKICIEKDNGLYDKLTINYEGLNSIDINTNKFIDAAINCIIKCINNYKKGIYKEYKEPSEILNNLNNYDIEMITETLRSKISDNLLLELESSNIDIIKIALAYGYNDILEQYYLPKQNNEIKLYRKEKMKWK